MDYNKIAFKLSVLCCLILVVIGSVLFALYGNQQSQITQQNDELRHLQRYISKINEMSGHKVSELEWQGAKLKEKLLATQEELTRSAVIGNIDCKDLLTTGQNVTDGVYNIFVGHMPVQVQCDMANGGWTIFQHRFNGSVNFRQNFVTYVNGFGDPQTEYWLGLEKIYQMTRVGRWILRVDMRSFNGDTAYAEYSDFKVHAGPGYRLEIGTYNGTAGNSLAHSNGGLWSTYDRDQDALHGRNCAADDYFNGAWWFNSCSHSNLNSYTYNDTREHKGMDWYHFKGWYTPMKTTIMKMRRVNSLKIT